MTFYDVVDATWPAAARHRVGPWLVRAGDGGGKRVSAATAEAEWRIADIAAAEAEHARIGQTPLFMIRAGEDRLDATLAARGYRLVDPVAICAAPVARLAVDPPPPTTAFCIWPMLAIMREIWAEGDVGPDRLAIMQRATGAKTAILVRARNHASGDGAGQAPGHLAGRAAGVAFVACAGQTAMLHALQVTPALRRQGIAVQIMRAAAFWAQDIGAKRFSVVVTTANTGARALYASLGLDDVGYYHYRSR